MKLNVSYQISQRSLEAAKSLLQSSSYPHALTELKLCKVEEKLAQRIGENLRYYEKLTADIMDLLEKENLLVFVFYLNYYFLL